MCSNVTLLELCSKETEVLFCTSKNPTFPFTNFRLINLSMRT